MIFSGKLFSILFIALLALTMILGAGCAKKKSGDGDDEDDASDDDVESGVGSYSIHLNMVPVTLDSQAEATTQSLFDANGQSLNVATILLSDLIDALDPFSEDANNFSYEFITEYESATVGPIDYADLPKLAFYEDADAESLCLAWTESGRGDDSMCGMENGLIVTHPKQGAFDLKSLEWINERSGDQPIHLGETVAVKAVVSVGANTIVSGDYLKTYLLQDGYGLKIFADSEATELSQGYVGSLTTGIETFIGDEVFVLGRATVHDGMIEFVPKSGYHLAVLSTNNAIEEPKLLTTNELIDENHRYAGSLVRINDVKIVDVDAEDPATDWPVYGTKSKDIFIRQTSGGPKINCLAYENTGLPGSEKPADGFDIIGVTEIDGDSANIFPRRVEDINPSEQNLEGQVRVTIIGEDISELIDLSELATGLQPLGDDDALIPVVSFAEVAQAAGLTRNPKLMEFKPVAYDDRQPFDTVEFDDLKSGVLYQGIPDDGEQPDPMVNSHFWPGMDLSENYFLQGIDRINAYRGVEVESEKISIPINCADFHKTP